MRLRVIKKILDENIPLLQLEIMETTRNGTRFYKLVNFRELQWAILEIDKLNLFNERIANLKEFLSYSYSNEATFFSHNEYNHLSSQVKFLYEECENLATALSHLIKEESTNLVSIKIPEPKDFADLAEISSKLNIIFSQVILNPDINGNIKITNFDNGSYWIDVLIVGTGVLQLVAGLAWSGAIVYKKLQEGRLLQAKVKEMDISNEAFKEIIEKSKEDTNKVAEAEANFLYETFFKGKDNEQVARIKMALKELAELYSRGAEIHPALNASLEIKKEFPDLKKIETTETKRKKLPSKKK